MKKEIKLNFLGIIGWLVVSLFIVGVLRLQYMWAAISFFPIWVVQEFLAERQKKVKINTVRFIAFGGILLPLYFLIALEKASTSLIFLVFPLLAIVDSVMITYAKKRGMIIVDERLEEVNRRASRWTLQITIIAIFLLIFLFEYYSFEIKITTLLMYLAGFIGLVYLAFWLNYERIHGALWSLPDESKE
ncbi:hypothetical protein BMS3Abin16_00837 [archaeon BMS3Abin16]|nr:hypothetical protein BMS3Abin16_00837 [archaeon BMS3Abin16]